MEELQQEQSKKEQELKEIRDLHLVQISTLQEKINNLVSILETVTNLLKKKSVFNFV